MYNVSTVIGKGKVNKMKRNDAMKELNKELTKLKEFTRLWKEVKRVTKKDGGDYANLAKNFEGLSISRSAIENSWVTLRVYTWIGGFGYVSDEEIIYPGREQVEGVTADIVAKKIEEVITLRGEQIQAIEEDIQTFDAINEELRQAYARAVSARKKAKSCKLRELIDNNHDRGIYSMKYEFDNANGLEYN